jgi:hypothetical protein
MKSPSTPLRTLILALLVAACSTGGPALTASPAGEDGSADPGRGSGGATQPGDIGSVPPDEPVGSEPGASDPGQGGNDGAGGGGGIDPEPGQPQLVVPVPGQLDVHPVAIEELVARVEGRHAVLNAIWWSGVEPCYVLDSVFWKLDPPTATITVSLHEGSAPGDAMCIEIAVQKAVVIDLGELPPGTYTVTASDGPAPDITFTID